MKFKLSPIILCLITIFASCNSKVDNPEDSSRIADIIATGQDSIFVNPMGEYKVFSDAQKGLSDSASYYRLELFKGICQLIVGNTDKCLESQIAVKKFIDNNKNNYELEGTYWSHRATVYHNFLGLNDSTIYFYQKGYEAFSKTTVPQPLIDVCINIADTYKDEGNFPETAKYYQKALFISDSTKTTSSLLSIYTGLGQVYAEMKDKNYADKYFKDAAQRLKGAKDYELYYYYNSLGNHQYYQKEYKASLESFKKCYAIVKKFQSPDITAMTEGNLGEVYMYLNDIKNAENNLKKASDYYNNTPNVNLEVQFYINSLMSNLYLIKENPTMAHAYLAKMTDNSGIRPRYMALYYRRLEKYYLTQNNYQLAYNFQEKARKIEDSISNSVVKNQITEITYRYTQDTTILHRNITIVNHEHQINKLYWLLALLIILIVVTIIATLFFYKAKQRKTELKELKLVNSLHSLRMANIRNRISPHFIFNVLNRELSVENKGIQNLVLLMRRNLELCDRFGVSLQEEIEFVDTYVAIESAALGPKFKYEKEIDSSIDTDKILIPSMIIQIFVENAIKHGLRGFSGDKHLLLNVTDSNGTLNIEIVNNGNMFSEGIKTDSTHTGMKVITQTIQILNEANQNKIDLKIGSKEFDDGSKGWDVVLKIPHDYDFHVIDNESRH